MYWIKDYTDRVRALLSDGGAASLTYAALEIRLALERVCYERLRNAHQYISPNELKTWKPQYVVETLMKRVDPNIAREWTLQVELNSGDGNFTNVGTQKGF